MGERHSGGCGEKVSNFEWGLFWAEQTRTGDLPFNGCINDALIPRST